MRLRAPHLLLLLLAAVLPAGVPASKRAKPVLLLDKPYPVEATIAQPGALLHWLDSIGGLSGPGMTGGKTRRAHTQDFEAAHGKPTGEDEDALRRFSRARVRLGDKDPAASTALTLACFRAATLDEALDAVAGRVPADDLAELRATLQYFAPRYEKIWDGGRIPRAFLARAQRDRQGKAAAEFLAALVRFYAEPLPREGERPIAVLVPVREGHGTHAQAVENYLLIEVREHDELVDQLEPLVHENAHYLWNRLPAERVAALHTLAQTLGGQALGLWGLLREGLPTALGQGVAGQRFLGNAWTDRRPWYHVAEVDAYAKRLFPLVQQALEARSTLDEPLVRRMLTVDAPPAPASPRSP
ncbi:MAG TPA: hypothetical protein VJS92_00095 [Candidatus Polarisedimenticolaceae bacterium]|nr:hypothetical protein [Candidatus Polarisedimenticolaceae bacterium]